MTLLLRCGYLALLTLLLPLALHAESLQPLLQTAEDAIAADVKSQRRIDQLDDATRQMLEQYRSASRQAESLQLYNQQLERLLGSQEQEAASLQQQIEAVELTQQQVVPLMARMLASLEQFVDLDLPFLPQERQQRLEKLRALLDRADITVAEKYRRLLEAYQVENDYGRTIEAYRDRLDLDGQNRLVDLLRVGRLALYYQSLDGVESGRWDRASGAWQPLGDDYRKLIQQGLRIARKEIAPDLLYLPVNGAEVHR